MRVVFRCRRCRKFKSKWNVLPSITVTIKFIRWLEFYLMYECVCVRGKFFWPLIMYKWMTKRQKSKRWAQQKPCANEWMNRYKHTHTPIRRERVRPNGRPRRKANTQTDIQNANEIYTRWNLWSGMRVALFVCSIPMWLIGFVPWNINACVM